VSHGLRMRRVAAACAIAVLLLSTVVLRVSAATQSFPDGRSVSTWGDQCDNYLPGTSRILTAHGVSVSGAFLGGQQSIRVKPFVQFSYDQRSWQNWAAASNLFQAAQTDVAFSNIVVRIGPWGSAALPAASRYYFVRVVYLVEWLNQGTSTFVFEDIHTTNFIVQSRTIPLSQACVIHAAR
jgi:hypothetical protein